MVVIKYGDHDAFLTACGCAVIFIWLVALFIVALFIATLFMMPSTPTSEQSATTMRQPQNFLRKNKLIVFLSVVLIFGFLTTSLISFNASRSSIRQSIIQNELPLTTDNIYSEIQKDLIRPVFISSMMASDTFLRDWVLAGERDPTQVHKYLKDVKHRSNAFTSFFVSDRSLHYYYGDGDTKVLSSQKKADQWYFNVRSMNEPYELNVDHDLKLSQNLIVFVNHRMFDYEGKFIGVTGVGITVHDVQSMLDDYKKRFARNVYFVDQSGLVVLSGDANKPIGLNVHQVEGLSKIAPLLIPTANTQMQYQRDHINYLVNLRYVPELEWYLVVEKNEQDATADVRQTLFVNLALCVLIVGLVLWVTHGIIRRYRQDIEQLSTIDRLTGLPNRSAFDGLASRYMSDAKRRQQPLALLMLDVDFFKQVNDRYGHLAGDMALQMVADQLKACRRGADFVCRWGGEEFLMLLKDCSASDAQIIAEQIRVRIAAQVVQFDGHAFSVTISSGVAAVRANESLERWLSRTDQYLYKAKRLGRDQVVAVIDQGSDDH